MNKATAATQLAKRAPRATSTYTPRRYADRREACATLAYRAGSICVAPDSSGLNRTTETGWTLLELAMALRSSVEALD